MTYYSKICMNFFFKKYILFTKPEKGDCQLINSVMMICRIWYKIQILTK